MEVVMLLLMVTGGDMHIQLTSDGVPAMFALAKGKGCKYKICTHRGLLAASVVSFSAVLYRSRTLQHTCEVLAGDGSSKAVQAVRKTGLSRH
jgi:hypothetical protein